jgi:hypothetical protein
MSKQKRVTEAGRYWLQIDRQTKGSYDELEAAQAAGEALKKRFPNVHVALYDRQSGLHSVLRHAGA